MIEQKVKNLDLDYTEGWVIFTWQRQGEIEVDHWLLYHFHWQVQKFSKLGFWQVSFLFYLFRLVDFHEINISKTFNPYVETNPAPELR